MIKGMGLVMDSEIEKKHVDACPVCGVNGGNGNLCVQHALMTKDFEWVKNYLNRLEKFNTQSLYILEFAITDRKSLIINDVSIINGRLQVDEYLEHRNISEYKKRILQEIKVLEKARYTVINIISSNGNGNENKE